MSNLKDRQRHVVPDLSKPSVAGLVYLLRHKEQWPRGFDWNYALCTCCGMGLADEMWGTGHHSMQVADAIGMNRVAANKIFCCMSSGHVEPCDVADALEALR